MGDMEKVLDGEASELYKLLHGIDEEYQKDLLSENIEAEKKRTDNAASILIELVHLIAAYLSDKRVRNDKNKESISFRRIVDMYTILHQTARTKHSLLIRYRGFPNDKNAEASPDYEIIYGNTTIDSAATAEIMKRLGVAKTSLADHLQSAFQNLFRNKVYSLYLRYRGKNKSETRRFHDSIRALAHFQDAAASDQTIRFRSDAGKEVIYPLMRNHDDVHDENLTLLGICNNIKPDSLASMIKKISSTNLTSQYMSVYNAIFSVKKLRGRLIRPSIEINNVVWLLADQEKEVLTQEKSEVAQFAIKHAGGSPLEAAKILKSVYGKDYERINATDLGERLQVSSDFLTSVDKAPKSKEMRQEILGNIEQRLDKVSDHVIDDLFSQAQADAYASDQKSGFLGAIHGKLSSAVTFYKKRIDTKKKMRQIVNNAVKFNLNDFETLSKDFEISVEDAKALIEMLKTCFDENGKFIRGAFRAIMPEFTRYERKIFEFLWHYLREYVHQSDRMAFLNSLQLLLARMQKPKMAVKTLLEDFYQEPEQISYSDTKALMLCSLLIRKYNQELVDLEFTPEDILKVKEGLDKGVVDYTAWRISKDQNNFFDKIKTIHRTVIEVIDIGENEKFPLPPEYLLKLEREVYIFLSLVGGVTARSVVISALKDYSDPESPLYKGTHSHQYINVLLQNLRITVRGLGRLGSVEDLHYLDTLRTNGERLAALGNSATTKKLISRISDWAEESRKAIVDPEAYQSEESNAANASVN